MRHKEKRLSLSELRLPVFIFTAATVIVLNLRILPAIIAGENFFSISPQYGAALKNFYNEEKNKTGFDRNWYAYYLVERNFSRWTLVAADKSDSYFSGMYNFNFGGLLTTRIRPKGYKLSPVEIRDLLQRPHWRGLIRRLGTLIIILPEKGMSPGDVLMVRHGETVLMVPAVYLTRHLSAL